MKIEEKSVAQYLLEQADEAGVSYAAVSDGHVFTFTTAVLERLLAKSRVTGKAILFIQRGARA